MKNPLLGCSISTGSRSIIQSLLQQERETSCSAVLKQKLVFVWFLVQSYIVSCTKRYQKCARQRLTSHWVRPHLFLNTSHNPTISLKNKVKRRLKVADVHTLIYAVMMQCEQHRFVTPGAAWPKFRVPFSLMGEDRVTLCAAILIQKRLTLEISTANWSLVRAR